MSIVIWLWGHIKKFYGYHGMGKEHIEQQNQDVTGQAETEGSVQHDGI